MGWDLLKNNKVSLSTLTYTFFSVLSLFEQTRSKIVPLLTLQTFFLELVQWLLVNVIGIGEKFFFCVAFNKEIRVGWETISEALFICLLKLKFSALFNKACDWGLIQIRRKTSICEFLTIQRFCDFR